MMWYKGACYAIRTGSVTFNMDGKSIYVLHDLKYKSEDGMKKFSPEHWHRQIERLKNIEWKFNIFEWVLI